MSYTNRLVGDYVDPAAPISTVDNHDRVRWEPILAGLVTAITTQLNGGDIGSVVRIWAISSLLISLFVGDWMTACTCEPMSKSSDENSLSFCLLADQT
ncbi:MAG: hypothetical protein HY785_13075 [Oscillatoriophycideae cyanobacterium NC_groundwater_1537_Pr4_S-0.65um_50_18]|nr:hypothetical protein [Oscillatoriophycideae cyanobacterium NC_groundwater_1537_Pr4_S-0.65um_50_18]